MKSYESLVMPVDMGLSVSDNRAALNSFTAFTHVPESEKRRITFPGIPGREHNTHAGYVRKNDKDKKQLVHYTSELHEAVGGYLRSAPFEVRTFIETASEIHAIAASGLQKAIRQIDDRLVSVHFPPRQINNHHLRFVVYENASAAAHYDQSTLTVALCETGPGLRVGTDATDLKEYQREPNQPILFPGYGWLNLHKMLGISTQYLPAWHDVLIPEDEQELGVGRAAIILFANPAYIDTSSTKHQAATVLNQEMITEWEDRGVLALAA